MAPPAPTTTIRWRPPPVDAELHSSALVPLARGVKLAPSDEVRIVPPPPVTTQVDPRCVTLRNSRLPGAVATVSQLPSERRRATAPLTPAASTFVPSEPTP